MRASGSFEKLLRCATLCNNVKWDANSRYKKVRNPKYRRSRKGSSSENGENNEPPFISDKNQPLPFMIEIPQVVDKEGTVVMVPKFNWKPLSDATECALAKFAQPINDLEMMQKKMGGSGTSSVQLCKQVSNHGTTQSRVRQRRKRQETIGYFAHRNERCGRLCNSEMR